MERAIPLVSVRRGAIEESLHRGALVLLHGEDEICVRGDAAWVVYYRSVSKPLQALVAVTSGAADALDLVDEELAVATGSHNAEPRQLEMVRSILAKAGLDEGHLSCGGHYSIDASRAREQHRSTDTPPPIWSSCSGKHALMLATARHLGQPLGTYLDPSHPLQMTIREHIARLAGMDVDAVIVGRDDCGTPAYAVPLRNLALSLQRFGQPDALPPALARACRRVAAAMDRHPRMVGGLRRIDTDLMEGTQEVLLAKAGAEGVYGWVAPARGLALALKAEDGSDRAWRLVVVDLLEQVGILDHPTAATIRSRHCDPVIRDHGGVPVGRLVAQTPDTSALQGFPDGNA